MAITGVITARKGPSAEMDESKMKVGELAVATDKPILWFCWAPGQVVKVALEGSAGGSSYTLPQADADTLGGVKAKAKTTETVEVAIDPATGKLYIPAGGGSITSDEIAAAVAAYIQANPIAETDPTVPEWAKNPAPPTYTAEDVGADPSGTAAAKVSEHNAAVDAHGDIRLLLQELANRVNTILDSDDTTLDQMSEIVAYIKSNKTLIDGITTGKINTADIINNLTTNAANKPLSAAQGVALKGLIDAIVVPEALPNPHKLIFTGGVVAEYDGSGAVTVTIPDGSGGAGGTQRIEKGSTDTVVELQPNKLYVFPEMTTLTYTLAAGEAGVANEYHFLFQSGATPTEVVHPEGVNIGSLTVEANKIYEISVMENMLTSQSWAVTV